MSRGFCCVLPTSMTRVGNGRFWAVRREHLLCFARHSSCHTFAAAKLASEAGSGCTSLASISSNPFGACPGAIETSKVARFLIAPFGRSWTATRYGMPCASGLQSLRPRYICSPKALLLNAVSRFCGSIPSETELCCHMLLHNWQPFPEAANRDWRSL